MIPPGVLPVVCAVIFDARGRVLLAQRPAHKHLGGKWEFPGGKIEAHETPTAALERELYEELGCRVTVDETLPTVHHDYGSVHIALLPFICHLSASSAPPHPHEHTALQWMALDELNHVDLAPADLPIVAHLRTRS